MFKSIKRQAIAATVTGLLLVGFSASSGASIILTVERQSDTTALITGSGTTDFSGYSISMTGAATTGDSGLDGLSGDFAIGADPLVYAYVRYLTNDVWLSMDDDWFAGVAISGSALVTLDVETWAAVGSSGTVTIQGGIFEGQTTGTWTMVDGASVPEPGILGLFGLGIVGLGFARRRKLTA